MTPELALAKVRMAAKSCSAKGGASGQLAKWAKRSRQSVSNWRKIPPGCVLRLEKIPEIGLTRYQMRPDIYGAKPQ